MAKPKQTVTEISPGTPAEHLGFMGRIKAVSAFFSETVVEMKRIRWPGRKEVVNYTVAALVTCLAMGFLVWVFDIGVSKLMSLAGLV